MLFRVFSVWYFYDKQMSFQFNNMTFCVVLTGMNIASIVKYSYLVVAVYVVFLQWIFCLIILQRLGPSKTQQLNTKVLFWMILILMLSKHDCSVANFKRVVRFFENKGGFHERIWNTCNKDFTNEKPLPSILIRFFILIKVKKKIYQ